MRRVKGGLALFFIVIVWLIVAAYGIWHYAYLETAPPVFDALSYVHKAQSFWAAVTKGLPFNPFDLAPQIRPFGTVFFTHPFGFSTDFHQFFFLTNFLPALLLAIAMVIAAGSLRNLDHGQRITLTIVLLCMTSMPAYFQFASSGDNRFMGTWGFVDILFGAISALACAFTVTAMRGRYLFWSALSALCAIFAILIKPAGLAVMAIVAGTWAGLTFSQWHSKSLELRTALRAGAAFLLLFAVTGLILHRSKYFSHENYAYGISSMELLHAGQQSFPTGMAILEKLRVSIGLPVFILWILCLGFAVRARLWMSTFCSLLIFFGGCYIWLIRTNLNHVRYFFPFGIMAVVVVFPALIQSVRGWSYKRLALLSALTLPTLAIAILLLVPQPPERGQFLLGINLLANKNADAVKQADALVDELASEPARLSIIYYVGGTPKINAFEGVMDWNRELGFRGGNSNPALPIDWVRPAAYRLDELLRARFIVFEPVADAQRVLDTEHVVETYWAEQTLVRAWLTTLKPADGVRVIEDGGTRVLEVVNRFALNQAGVELTRGRKLRGVFVLGFHPMTGIPVRNATALSGNLLTKPIDLSVDGSTVARALAVTHEQTAVGSIYHIVIEQLVVLPANEDGNWHVFLHVLDKNGKIIKDGYQIYISDAASSTTALQYDISIPKQASSAPAFVAFGVFNPRPAGKSQSFISSGGDWSGRRNIVALPTGTAQ